MTEQLNGLLQITEEFARETMVGTTTGLRASVWLFASGKRVAKAGWGADIEKKPVFATVRETLRELGAAAYVSFSQARGQTSFDPKPVELVLVFASDGAKTVTRILNIVRDCQGTIQALTSNSDLVKYLVGLFGESGLNEQLLGMVESFRRWSSRPHDAATHRE